MKNHSSIVDDRFTESQTALNKDVTALRPKLIDQFSSWAVEGALRALADNDNPLRLSFFSIAMRILFEHIMDTLSPENQVVRTPWFKSESPEGKPTRWQRVMFAIQGGLSETFVKGELKVDLPPLRKRLLDSIDELSKHVHGREQTIVRDQSEQDVVVRRTVAAMAAFLDALHECRDAVLMPIADALDDAAIYALLTDTIVEVDELASHNSVDEVHVDRVTVHTIGFDTITYRVTGSIEVTLQWGSNSDVRRGDGVELGQSFPFQCEFQLPLDDLWDLDRAEPTYGVDTGAWREYDEAT
jgi:hypothetical protein